MRQGTIFIDEQDTSEQTCLLVILEHMVFQTRDLKEMANDYAIVNLVPEHLAEVRRQREPMIDKTLKAVHNRLTREISYWDYRAEELKEQEQAGRVNAKINSAKARARADELSSRLRRRVDELKEERNLTASPPVVSGGAMIIPIGLLWKTGGTSGASDLFARDIKRVELLAMQAVMNHEKDLGFVPRDVSAEKVGYDIESVIPETGTLRFIEVKGRVIGSTTVTVTKNEILTALNKPEDFFLALVEVDGERTTVRYVQHPFKKEPDFAATSVNYDINELI